MMSTTVQRILIHQDVIRTNSYSGPRPIIPLLSLFLSLSLPIYLIILLYIYIYTFTYTFTLYLNQSYSFLLPRELSCNLIIFVHRQVSSPKWREVPIRLQCNEISVCPATSSDDATLCYVFERRGEEEALEDSRGVTRMHESLSLSLSFSPSLSLSLSFVSREDRDARARYVIWEGGEEEREGERERERESSW